MQSSLLFDRAASAARYDRFYKQENPPRVSSRRDRNTGNAGEICRLPVNLDRQAHGWKFPRKQGNGAPDTAGSGALYVLM